MKKRMMKALAFLLAAVFVLSLCACAPTNASRPGKSTDAPNAADIEKTAAPEETGAGLPETDAQDPTPTPAEALYTVVPLSEAKVGDVVVFGSYEQDGNTENGKEPLEWLVLSGEGGTLFLITLYAIENMQFHSSLDKVTWETSALRGWLNNDFLNAAFSSDEKGMIKTSTVIAESNPEYPNSPAGNDTEDKVFLLSRQEADQYFENNEARKCAPTAAARASEPDSFSKMGKAKPWYANDTYGCGWWLRSPGMFKDLYVSCVGKYGDIKDSGQVYLIGTDTCVRPALRVSVG